MQFLPPPGPERRRQTVRLLVLLVVLVGVWWYWSGPTVPPAPASNQVGPAAIGAPAAQLPVPDPLSLEALRRSTDLDEASRNPFVFGQRQVASAPGSAFLTPPVPSAGRSGPQAPVPPSGPPPIPLRLTGMTVATTGGRTLVTLKDLATNALYQAFEGDIVDGRYRIVKVGVESAVVSYVNGSGVRTLALGR